MMIDRISRNKISRIICILFLVRIAISAGTKAAWGEEPGTLKWRYLTGNWVTSSPAIGADGTIYVGSLDGYLYALNPDGTLKWRYEAGKVWSSPAIGADGTIYVGSLDGYLYALNPDGTLKWRYEAGKVWSSPAIGADGTVYVGDDAGYIHARSPDGSFKWLFEAESSVHSSPSIDSDGTVYVGDVDGYLYALNPDGTLKWRYEAGDSVYSSPAIGADGTIYVGSLDGYLYALNPDGTLKWRYEAGAYLWSSSPSIDSDGTVYVGSWDRYLYAINPNGNLKWRLETGGSVESSPAIGADGTIYVGSSDGYLYALNPDGTLKWRYEIGTSVNSSPAIGSDGTLFVGSWDGDLGYLFAIHSSSMGLADSPWPMRGHDVMHTGRFKGAEINHSESFNQGDIESDNIEGLNEDPTLLNYKAYACTAALSALDGIIENKFCLEAEDYAFSFLNKQIKPLYSQLVDITTGVMVDRYLPGVSDLLTVISLFQDTTHMNTLRQYCWDVPHWKYETFVDQSIYSWDEISNYIHKSSVSQKPIDENFENILELLSVSDPRYDIASKANKIVAFLKNNCNSSDYLGYYFLPRPVYSDVPFIFTYQGIVTHPDQSKMKTFEEMKPIAVGEVASGGTTLTLSVDYIHRILVPSNAYLCVKLIHGTNLWCSDSNFSWWDATTTPIKVFQENLLPGKRIHLTKEYKNINLGLEFYFFIIPRDENDIQHAIGWMTYFGN